MIRVGDNIPNVKLFRMSEKGPEAIVASDWFSGKHVVLFAVPGAFTPTCSAKHLPGYLEQSEKFYVERINIFGNFITFENVIRNQLIIDEGDAYNEILLNKSINNLKAINVFSKVRVASRTCNLFHVSVVFLFFIF